MQPRAERLLAFVTERFPFARDLVARTLQGGEPGEDLIPRLREQLRAAVPVGGGEILPGTDTARRFEEAGAELLAAIDGFRGREDRAAALTDEARLEILRGMALTRATDNQLKSFFLGGQVRFRGTSFQGKGFRSLGQEAIYAAPLLLRRGPDHRGADGSWSGDVVAPLIRDLGAALAMHPTPEMVESVLRAQMAKAGPPMDGRDLHIGDLSWGVLPASAPLAISTATVAGLAMAFALEGSGRVAVSFIGEGGSSLGEWHESINVCAARKLPAVFCVENNQTALSTPLGDQSAVRRFADKAAGYGIPGITIDGTDPAAIAAAFGWAADRARAGEGPALIELLAMRMCGHAHHDDMLYLGKEPPIGWDYYPPQAAGYADREAFAFWRERDPLETWARDLTDRGLLGPDGLASVRAEADRVVAECAARVVDAPWPDPERVGVGVLAGEAPRRRVDPLVGNPRRSPRLPPVEPAPAFTRGGVTFLEAVMLGVRDALAEDPRAFVYGQDVGGRYGNAFLLLRPLLEEFGDRIVNSPLCEGGILGVCVGAALAGQRPIGEIQFNDFVATGFNQLVNNAAKIRYRWGGEVPMVVRMPWGGLRHAGPYHSQNTEPWFYRVPGIKIVAPSTPHDARALLAAAHADPDPVLFYEHIALYRDPKIKQELGPGAPSPLPLGRAALRRAGADLALVSYGAYVHRCLRLAERLAADSIECAVLDLRSLAPLDRETLLDVSRYCGKVLVVHEDSRTGGIGESLAAIVQEEAFEDLDAPVRVIGALDTPVPYSPALEERFLPSDEELEHAARTLAAY